MAFPRTCEECSGPRRTNPATGTLYSCRACNTEAVIDAKVAEIDQDPPVIVWRRGRHGITYPVSVYDPHADTASPLRMHRKVSA